MLYNIEYYPIVSRLYWVRNCEKVEMEKEQMFVLAKTVFFYNIAT